MHFLQRTYCLKLYRMAFFLLFVVGMQVLGAGSKSVSGNIGNSRDIVSLPEGIFSRLLTYTTQSQKFPTCTIAADKGERQSLKLYFFTCEKENISEDEEKEIGENSGGIKRYKSNYFKTYHLALTLFQHSFIKKLSLALLSTVVFLH